MPESTQRFGDSHKRRVRALLTDFVEEVGRCNTAEITDLGNEMAGRGNDPSISDWRRKVYRQVAALVRRVS